MNCNICKFQREHKCFNPHNFQPRQRQYTQVKQLSYLFYPKAPTWCKGYQEQDELYCLICERFVFTLFHIADDGCCCTGAMGEMITYCPPPELHPHWEMIF